jgi:hypothetical protein
LADELANPAHPLDGGLRVIAEFLRHSARAAAAAELPNGAPDRLDDHLGGGVRPIVQRGRE